MNEKRLRVNRFAKVAALVAVTALAGFESGNTRISAQYDDGCRANSWTPEIFSFYGDHDKIIDKLRRYDMTLADRRVYMYMVETAKEAKLVLYERPKSGSEQPWTIWRWYGKETEASEFWQTETKQILELKGVNCVGEQTEKLVKALTGSKKDEPPPTHPPATGAQVFDEMMKEYGSSYIRASVFLLC